MEAPRTKKRRRGSGDGEVSLTYKPRNEKYDGGCNVTQKWVSSSYQADIVLFILLFHKILTESLHQYAEHPKMERCSSCKKYMRPVDLGDDEEDN